MSMTLGRVSIHTGGYPIISWWRTRRCGIVYVKRTLPLEVQWSKVRVAPFYQTLGRGTNSCLSDDDGAVTGASV